MQAGPRAFGDGKHPSTAMLLAALEGIAPEQFTPTRALDVGAGSGILSFAMAARFGCPVIACELQREAFEVLQENIAANGYGGRITALHANGVAHPQLQQAAPFALVVMNILAEPLLALAHAVGAVLEEGGVLMLSGLLAWQEEAVREAYLGLGLELSARLSSGDWVALIFQKP
jgi:ribosomal protein L11 methyltransferase